ncbi:uncharacterized protein LOC143258655 isoform X1 [Tachypleus tridentatus]|uniref:uncharacterized protein LOC143258655 isoform X1 n=1 Tax=Tachypleus tridentatus TaxID=6853 RepID=UPI003FD07A70
MVGGVSGYQIFPFPVDPPTNLNKIVKKQSMGKRPRLGDSEQQSSTSVTHVPHFLILHSLSEKPLGQLSPFFIQKGLAGSPKSVKKLRSGDVLVETSTSQHSELLLNSRAIGDIPIEVTPHATLNSSRGVIVEMELKNVPESEILAGLSTQGVSAVRHISTRKDGVYTANKYPRFDIYFITCTCHHQGRLSHLQGSAIHSKPSPMFPMSEIWPLKDDMSWFLDMCSLWGQGP